MRLCTSSLCKVFEIAVCCPNKGALLEMFTTGLTGQSLRTSSYSRISSLCNEIVQRLPARFPAAARSDWEEATASNLAMHKRLLRQRIMFLASELQKRKQQLKVAETVDHQLSVAKLLETETTDEADASRRSYFFQAAVDEWYDQLPECTFRSAFIPITAEDAHVIISHWKEVTCQLEAGASTEIPHALAGLVQRIDQLISETFGSNGIFVKLSTRSPKDSKTIFRKATTAFHARLDSNRDRVCNNNSVIGTSRDNERLVAFSEEMVKAAIARNGQDAVTYLLDSWRVAEDLMYAYENESKGDEQVYPISLVLREWDARITPKCEFRAFVWDNKLTCIGQYWHSLYFPELKAKKDEIARDCQRFFNKIQASLPVPNAMLDLAWMAPGEVILVEINPLMEGLGSFKGSTGLFDFYEDQELLTGQLPFEIRIREVEEDRATLISHMSMEWRGTVLGF